MAEGDNNAASCKGKFGASRNAVLTTAGELRESFLVETARRRRSKFEMGAGEGEEGRESENCGLHFEGSVVTRWGREIDWRVYLNTN